MEVVLASGEIVHANRLSHPELFKALKGGSNNSGIVTKFNLRTFSQGEFLGGITVHPISALMQQLEAFESFMNPSHFDLKATVIQAFVFSSSTNTTLVSNDNEYTLPVKSSAVLQPFMDIKPQLYSTLRISNLLSFVIEQASFQPNDTR